MSNECDECGEHALECVCGWCEIDKSANRNLGCDPPGTEIKHTYINPMESIPIKNYDWIDVTKEFPTWLAASLIKRNLEETQLMLVFQSFEDNGMKEEFLKFLQTSKAKNIFDAMREFAKLHPDKFYVPDPMEPYGKFISLKKDT